jgi:hypothetical protein
VNGKTTGDTIYPEDCTVEPYTGEDGKTYTKVSLSVENLSRFETYTSADGGKILENTYASVRNSWGMVTIELTAKVDSKILVTVRVEPDSTKRLRPIG